ncbi:MAG: metallophosphoesterase [Anaerolineales bacterium]|jgi:DNA repair exonuclease SbcCD nuclease subunit
MIRLLLVADTHLGFDLPFHPRVERRRRGYDFFANFERALTPALRGEVNLVVHGGDLLYRSRVPNALIEMAMASLVRVADNGTPIYIVPGNHERSKIPLHLWSAHPNIHIFDRPRTFRYEVNGTPVVLAGFPFTRKVSVHFRDLVNATQHTLEKGRLRLLCIHQIVEGAKVGPSNYTFRGGADVIKGSEIPADFDVVLAGHIHRAQTLTHDLKGLKLAAPVVYPGSVERTSFAERNEDKGYIILTLDLAGNSQEQVVESEFFQLPARPMIKLELIYPRSEKSLAEQLRNRLKTIDPNAIVRVDLIGPGKDTARDLLTAARLREIAPSTMNIDLARDWSSKN